MAQQVIEKFVERIDAVLLPVKNLEKSLSWYHEIFGFPILHQWTRMAGLGTGINMGFLLVHVKDHTPNPDYAPITIAVSSIDEFHRMLAEKQVELTDIRSNQNEQYFELFDNSGNKISVIQSKSQSSDQMLVAIDSVQLPVRNLEQSSTWLKETFGFELLWSNEQEACFSVASNCSLRIREVMDFMPCKGYTPFNFLVKDVEEIRKRLSKKKVKVSSIKSNDPKRFDLTDINGHKISVIQ
jgi:catechol 2,3-dioxygenase-like lactoylglutathione lyase family enzyme